jgi:hypothetical protein
MRPNATNFKLKFPAFVAQPDADIEFAIEEAMVKCGEFGNGHWVDDANQTLAVYYLAAHTLQVQLMRASSGTGQIIQSERVPDMSITYAVPDQNKAIDFTMTIYGEKYLGLLRDNFPLIAVVNSAVKTW